MIDSKELINNIIISVQCPFARQWRIVEFNVDFHIDNKYPRSGVTKDALPPTLLFRPFFFHELKQRNKNWNFFTVRSSVTLFPSARFYLVWIRHVIWVGSRARVHVILIDLCGKGSFIIWRSVFIENKLRAEFCLIWFRAREIMARRGGYRKGVRKEAAAVAFLFGCFFLFISFHFIFVLFYILWNAFFFSIRKRIICILFSRPDPRELSP